MKENPIADKSYNFGCRIVDAYKFLKKSEDVMSKQLYRSGTAVGALVREGVFAQSKADFINKYSIALKEANETQYWLRLLHHGKFIDDKSFESIIKDAEEVTALLVSIIKTSKENASLQQI